MATGMTVTIQKNKRFRWVIFLVSLLGFNIVGCAELKRSGQVNEHEAKLWSLIDGIHQHLPINQEKVEQLTGSTLNEKRRNKYFVFLEGTPNLMADSPGQGIFSKTKFSYRLADSSESNLGVHMNSTFPCVDLDAVRDRYREGELTAPPLPPPHTPGKPLIKGFEYTAGYKIKTAWGTIAFQFSSESPSEVGCLAEISFGFKSTQSE